MPARAPRFLKSERLFAVASRILPGGVDSPVRAFKSVGGTPLFITHAAGSRIQDADGHTYIDCESGDPGAAGSGRGESDHDEE